MKRFALLYLLGTVLSGCDDAIPTLCPAVENPGLVVEVRDADRGTFIAEGAVAVAQDGGYVDTLLAAASSGDGTLRSLAGAYERPGTYTVSVSRPDYQTWRRANVRVSEGECGVRTVELEALLERE